MRANIARVVGLVVFASAVGTSTCADHDDVASPSAADATPAPSVAPTASSARETPSEPRRRLAYEPKLGPVVSAESGPIAAPFLTSRSSPARKADSIPDGKNGWLADDAALDWLVRHQAADGSWVASTRGPRCTSARCAGGAGASDVVGDTSLALLAICATGWGAPRVRAFHDGLAYLLSAQAADGSFGAASREHPVLDQALATEALCRSLDEKSGVAHRDAAKRAADRLLALRTSDAAWSETLAGATSDLRVTTWATMALADARLADVHVPDDAYRDLLVWLESEPGGRTVAAAAMRTCCRLFCGTDLREPRIAADLEILKSAEASPGGDGGPMDAADEYFATVAEFYWGGDVWRERRSVRFPNLLRRQHGLDDGCLMGSWDANVAGAPETDRVGATALTSMLFDAAYVSTYRNAMKQPLIPK